MNIDLTNRESDAIIELTKITGLTDVQVMRQALRLYQNVMLNKLIVTENYSLSKLCCLELE